MLCVTAAYRFARQEETENACCLDSASDQHQVALLCSVFYDFGAVCKCLGILHELYVVELAVNTPTKVYFSCLCLSI